MIINNIKILLRFTGNTCGYAKCDDVRLILLTFGSSVL